MISRVNYGLDTEVLSLLTPLTPLVADCTDSTDRLGDVGPPAPLVEGSSGWWDLVLVVVEVEIAVAREIGIRHRPLPCKYCMAEPMSSSISLATWCSVTFIVSLLDDDDAAAVCEPLPFLLAPPPPVDCTQSPPPCHKQRKRISTQYLLISIYICAAEVKIILITSHDLTIN